MYTMVNTSSYLDTTPQFCDEGTGLKNSARSSMMSKDDFGETQGCNRRENFSCHICHLIRGRNFDHLSPSIV